MLIVPKEYTSPTAATASPGDTGPTVSVRNDHACPEEQVPTVQHDSDPVFPAESGADVQRIAPSRRTKRKTAGKHKNKFKQPRTAVTSSITITVNELSVYLVLTTLLILYGLYI